MHACMEYNNIFVKWQSVVVVNVSRVISTTKPKVKGRIIENVLMHQMNSITSALTTMTIN